MALKKPSDLFEKKETSKVFETAEVSSDISESYDKFRSNFDKVNELSERVEVLSQQLSEKLNKTELENAMLSQLMVLDENFKSIKNQIKGLNKEDLREFKGTVYNLTELVENILDNEIPRYQKQITRNEIFIGEKVHQLEEVLEENIINIRSEIDDKINDIVEVVDNNIEYFNQQLEENVSQVKETKKVYSNLSKILENKIHREDKKFEEYSYIIESVQKTLSELKTQFFAVDNYLESNHQELVKLKEEVFAEIEKLPVGNLKENIERLERKIDYIKETYSKIEPEVVVKEVIKEGLLNEPPETDNSDPLTPLNQNFVTLDQLQQHYRLFLNRIQQQLSTLGGGGEVRLEFLDDIDRDSAKVNGRYLRYDSASDKWIGATAGGAGSQTLDDTLLLGNTSSLGMSVGVVTATTFVGNVTGTATTATTINILNTNGLTTVYYPTFVESRSDGQILRGDVDLTYRTDTNTLTVPNVSATTFTGALTGNATTANTAGYATTAGISTVSQGLTGIPNIVVGIVTATDMRASSISEKTTLVNGNTVSLIYNTGGGNIAICTNPSGDVTLNVTGIPTDSNFDNRSLTFSVIVNNTGTARSCTAINLNGLSKTIKWFGGSLSAAISGVTTSSGYDIYNFTGINTVGSANTTANYDILGTVNGSYR